MFLKRRDTEKRKNQGKTAFSCLWNCPGRIENSYTPIKMFKNNKKIKK